VNLGSRTKISRRIHVADKVSDNTL
jgi:hypothetical protein